MSLKSHFSDIELLECGCDEVGRGCIAGPVFAAAVILPYHYQNEEINDSKQLTAAKRTQLRSMIERDAVAWAVGQVSEKEIDKINILQASFLAMTRAVQQLSVKPQLLLIDGNRFVNRTDIPYRTVVKGDATYLSIAAASILAKCYRDELMERLHDEYPQYGWKDNKGYPTPYHQEAVLKYGNSPYHRRSFQLKRQLRLEFC
ncbi:MAG: ribonuclease HII [Bacteroidales bacterium]|nr:ribonuclease HII [Bacteroidales bacterium]